MHAAVELDAKGNCAEPPTRTIQAGDKTQLDPVQFDYLTAGVPERDLLFERAIHLPECLAQFQSGSRGFRDAVGLKRTPTPPAGQRVLVSMVCKICQVFHARGVSVSLRPLVTQVQIDTTGYCLACDNCVITIATVCLTFGLGSPHSFARRICNHG